MKNNKLNFMNLESKYSSLEKSKVVIIPIAYEGIVTFGFGASNGPKEIIKASKELEYYNCRSSSLDYEKGIFTNKLQNLKNIKDYSKATEKISKIVSSKDFNNRFKIILGGDHSTSLGVVKGLEREYGKDFGVLVFDAHSDLREPWGNKTWQHACVSRYICKDLNHKTLIAGVRSQDYYEKEFQDNNKDKIKVIYAKDLLDSSKNKFDLKNCKSFKKELKLLPKNIFVSIDVDVFDTSFIRCTNTPEPNGLNWNQLINLLKIVFENKNVIGTDLVEFSPDVSKDLYKQEAYFLSKLVYNIISFL